MSITNTEKASKIKIMEENKIEETCIAWFKKFWWDWEAELGETESSCTASQYKW